MKRFWAPWNAEFLEGTVATSPLEEMRRELERLAKKARAVSPEDAFEAAFCHIIEG